MTAADERGGGESPPPLPPLRPTADEWLPLPGFFLPPEWPTPPASGWTTWTSSEGTPHLPRHSSLVGPRPADWSQQQVVDAWTAAQEADNVYDSVDGLAVA